MSANFHTASPILRVNDLFERISYNVNKPGFIRVLQLSKLDKHKASII